ncbi:dTDP-4-amino-4,6-dideoxyglucose formyltransferase [Vibrio sp. Isolate32]|uniref:dTDP-4-amino-4,6-dideoxyglucose formyltransferase n=1 Tax=Vibrio sp. Isolate32 TaxID=2908538 RepID=UPI001EFD1F33|nr:dTDP-4-amino-4,6-dideoxyglucose formyltransferase [Vibrio sp. Isolate32]MCG9553880.1 dTDP-4-amino-4,6-dideoxyglucose formyltransferase [Vibrio sp. Isolate32]
MELINEPCYKQYDFSFSYSVINKNPDKLIELGMTSIDIKDLRVVSYILDSYDLVISAHCKQIFPKGLVENIRCINVHPGLNPHNRGWFPQVFSIINKKPIGCTIHLMNSEVDDGDILFQSEIKIEEDETSLCVYNRVINEEKKLLKEKFKNILDKNYVANPPCIKGNYNSILDFRNLTELDLESRGTLRQHLDLLRALSHGDFKNGYFLNCDGKKVYVTLNLEVESS